ncbi:hypothetical protein [uncultured Methylobacterium sp.]|jgi:hypothetical protein|uniref:hypothetical protein n=1 Tax=uncultured Methylobacterium sp. TaxID=157278 RepID=UPI00262C4262|nr:hypothetical protein [uncultured Methylobacterium sp.]
MDRRAFLSLGAASALATTLPALEQPAAAAAKKMDPATTRLVRGFWDSARQIRVKSRYTASNDEVRHAVEDYLARQGLKLPLRFDSVVKGEAFAVVYHRMQVITREDGRRELLLVASCPALPDVEPVVMNVEYPRA